MIRSLIREFLLQEEVFGAQAFVYHGSKAPPETILPVFLQDEFTPGVGVGDMYGKGLYAVYDLAGSKTESGKTYGQYIYKLKVNLYGFISFDSDVTRKIYKKDLSPSQQAELVGADKQIIKKLKRFDGKIVPKFSSDWAESASKYLRGKVKGLVYTGRNDGRCIVLYDVSVAVPIAWKTVDDTSWNKVDRESIKPALRRSSTGEWEKEKYGDDPIVLLKRLEKLPIEKRIVKGNLDLRNLSITSLPAGLKVEGVLSLSGTPITSLPDGLEVGSSLYLSDTQITFLPDGLSISGSLDLSNTPIASLPDGLKVSYDLFLNNTKIASVPANLQVGRDLYLRNAPITSLPNTLQVGGSLYLSDASITSFPVGLKVKRDLSLSGTPITSLPDDLQVKGDLDLSYTSITSLPAGLEVGGDLCLSGTKIISVPKSVKVGGKVIGLRQNLLKQDT